MDIITYVSDIAAMRVEAKIISSDHDNPLNKMFNVGHDDSVTFSVLKVPVHYTGGGESLCLVRGLEISDFEKCKTIKPIGECVRDGGDHVYRFFDSECESIYINARGDLNYFHDADGVTVNVKRPFMIGVF